ncbi:MAG: type III pantothenate kinase [Schleiferiaceae bacterium]|nr:type III pantothenate kinase [Schleiferiaceae bacterium]
MLSAVELGNTRTKVCRFNAKGEQMADTRHYDGGHTIWQNEIPIGDILRIANTAAVDLASSFEDQIVTLSNPWPFLFDCSPQIGIDRCLAALGARQKKAEGSIAVISCGTCLTATLLTEDNTLLGGPISPGWSTRLQSMADYAPALPRLLPAIQHLSSKGSQSTQDSMLQGSFGGMLAEIEHIIRVWRQEYPNLTVFLTGGDGPAFAKPLESGIFAASNLEALGLYAQYNYEQNL